MLIFRKRKRECTRDEYYNAMDQIDQNNINSKSFIKPEHSHNQIVLEHFDTQIVSDFKQRFEWDKNNQMEFSNNNMRVKNKDAYNTHSRIVISKEILGSNTKILFKTMIQRGRGCSFVGIYNDKMHVFGNYLCSHGETKG